MNKRKSDLPVEAFVSDEDEAMQLTTPKKGNPVRIPVPLKDDVMDVFKKATRKREKK